MSRFSPQRAAASTLVAAAFALLLWGTFAFGAVYDWAFRPIVYLGSAIGLLALLLERRGRPNLMRLTITFILIAGIVGLQLVPVGPQTRARISPAAARVQARYARTYGLLQPSSVDPDAAPQPERQPLSIAPRDTVVGLTLFAALAVFLLGMTRVLSVTGARPIATALVGTGIVLALVGIGQHLLTLGEPYPLVYGFWKPQNLSRPFGPFINPNHFAGWMLMTLPLTLGLLYDTIERMLAEEPNAHTRRIELAASPLFGTAATCGFAALVMGLALLMTRSRSGLVVFASISALSAWLVVRRQASRRARAVIVGSSVAIFAGAALWAGGDVLTSKFADRGSADLATLGNRLTTWSDAWRIARDFPVAGTGLNTFGTAMYVYQTSKPDTHFQEAHNDYLQLLAEGGVLLAGAALTALLVFAGDVRRRFREAPKEGTTYWLRVGATLGIVAIGVQSMVEFSLQMPGNALLFAVLCAIALHVSPRLRKT